MLFYLFAFLFGLAVGSFLNVVIDRLPRGEPLKGRSVCEDCRHPLAAGDLIPFFSWLALRGRCRFCRARLSVQYPLVELTAALLFLAVFHLTAGGNLQALPHLWPRLFFQFFLVSVFLTIFVMDLKLGVVLPEIVWPAILVVLFSSLAAGVAKIFTIYTTLKEDTAGLGPYLLRTDYLREQVFWEARSFFWVLAGALVAAAFFWMIVKLTRGRGMGEGDIGLGFLAGLVVGFPQVVLAVFLAFIFGGLFSSVLLLLKKKRWGETVPFGPFLSLATLLTFFFGDRILTWYLNLL